jgi:hypothetical protein
VVGAVLCKACEVLTQERRKAGLSGSVEIPQSNHIGVLLCQHCGAVLPAVDGVDTMLHKLSQLAQFGLGAGSAPLLTRARRGD